MTTWQTHLLAFVTGGIVSLWLTYHVLDRILAAKWVSLTRARKVSRTNVRE